MKDALIFIIVLLVIISCSKEHNLVVKQDQTKELSELDNGMPLYFVKEKNISFGDKVILGERIINPNKISFLKEMLSEMGMNISDEKLKPTHFYIKFLPESKEDLELLYLRAQSDGDLILEEIPFHYKIVQEGNKFQNPERKAKSLAPLYTTVRSDYKMPNVKYEILDSMFVPGFSKNLSEAERFALNMAELIGKAVNGDIEFNEEYLDDIALKLGIVFDDEGNITQQYFFSKVLKVVKKAIQVAAYVIEKSLHYIQSAIFLFFPDDHISGEIRIQNTYHNNYDPLNGMRVCVRNVFIFYNTSTDQNGRFSTSERCAKKQDFTVYLLNEDNLNNRLESGFDEQINILGTDLLSKLTNVFTNINKAGTVRSERTREQNKLTINSPDKTLWNKASVCNAIKEYNHFARENGIVEYKKSKLWLTSAGSLAGMFYTMKTHHLIGPNTNLITNVIGAVNLISDVVISSLPDVGIERTNNDTRELYRRVFHELTHYSHAMKHNDGSFWAKVVSGESMNILSSVFNGQNPYGDGNSPGNDAALPRAIGLAESWAYFMENYILYMYVNKNNTRKYDKYIDDGHNFGGIENISLRKIPSKYSHNWFPTGMYHDMIDKNQDSVILRDDNGKPYGDYKTIDKVRGYTVRQMYDWVCRSQSVDGFMNLALQNAPKATYLFNQEAYEKALLSAKNNYNRAYNEFYKYIYSLNIKDNISSGAVDENGNGIPVCFNGRCVPIIGAQDVYYALDLLKLNPSLSSYSSLEFYLMNTDSGYSGYELNKFYSSLTEYLESDRKILDFYNRNENKEYVEDMADNVRELFRVYNTRR